MENDVMICYCIIPKNTLRTKRKELADGSEVPVQIVNEYWEDGPAIQVPVTEFMNQISNYCPQWYAHIIDIEKPDT